MIENRGKRYEGIFGVLRKKGIFDDMKFNVLEGLILDRQDSKICGLRLVEWVLDLLTILKKIEKRIQRVLTPDQMTREFESEFIEAKESEFLRILNYCKIDILLTNKVIKCPQDDQEKFMKVKSAKEKIEEKLLNFFKHGDVLNDMSVINHMPSIENSERNYHGGDAVGRKSDPIGHLNQVVGSNRRLGKLKRVIEKSERNWKLELVTSFMMLKTNSTMASMSRIILNRSSMSSSRLSGSNLDKSNFLENDASFLKMLSTPPKNPEYEPQPVKLETEGEFFVSHKPSRDNFKRKPKKQTKRLSSKGRTIEEFFKNEPAKHPPVKKRKSSRAKTKRRKECRFGLYTMEDQKPKKRKRGIPTKKSNRE